MPSSTQIWTPYPTAENPIIWPDLPEWDSILIGNTILPIEGIPKYEHHLSADAKKPKGSDFYSITSHGIKPGPVHITLKLWVDVNPTRNGATPPNYLDMYRKLIPQLIAKQFNKRFSIPVYHPALAVFGVTSVVFTKVPTPQHVGGGVFHVELEGMDGRSVRDGLSQKEKKKPATNNLGSAAQTGAVRGVVSVIPGTLGGQVVVTTGGQTITSSFAEVLRERESEGLFTAEAFQSRANTPASRAGSP